MIDLGTEGKHLMEIVAFDEDDRADGNGKAGITWISKTLLNTPQVMNNDTLTSWEQCSLRSYLKNTIKPLMTSEIRNGIVEVVKKQCVASRIDVSNDDVWIPSLYEVCGKTYFELQGTGVHYSQIYATGTGTSTTQIKKGLDGIAKYWKTRSAFSQTQIYIIGPDGTTSQTKYNTANYIALGFCTN